MHHPDHLEIASIDLEPKAVASAGPSCWQAPRVSARLEALKGAAGPTYWERMGFVVTGEAGVDWHMEHPPRA